MATFNLKGPTKNPVLNSNGVQCKTLSFEDKFVVTVHCPISCYMSRHMFSSTPEAAFGKGEILIMYHIFYLKMVTEWQKRERERDRERDRERSHENSATPIDEK